MHRIVFITIQFHITKHILRIRDEFAYYFPLMNITVTFRLSKTFNYK